MIITAALLRASGACAEQRKAFAELFPQGTEVTLESATACVKAGLDLDWFAGAFLSPAEWATYDVARAAALVKAWDEGRGVKP